MSGETLSVRDNRTGQQAEIPIQSGTVKALDLRKFKANPEDFGLMTYDPGYTNTAACRSKITYIDGDKGILLYRGYPIEQLAEHYSYLDVVQLILDGELPASEDKTRFAREIAAEADLPPTIYRIIEAFDSNAHPMGMLTSVVAALSTCYPEAVQVGKPENRRKQTIRLIAKVPTIAAAGYRRRQGLPFVKPSRDLSFAGNFLHMMFEDSPAEDRIHPALEHALDVLFTLHADHEQNCSTSAMRAIGSSRPDPYLSAAGAIAALAGPLHGGANEAVLDMLREIGDKSRTPEHIRKVKAGEGRLMGFGHRVYKNYDPRAKIIKQMAEQVFKVTGSNPLLDIAIELEQIALKDDYFVSRKLYPNVDFYSGLIYEAMGFPSVMFPVLFAVGRMAGWTAQWEELLADPEQKIARPRQIYEGYPTRDVPVRHKG